VKKKQSKKQSRLSFDIYPDWTMAGTVKKMEFQMPTFKFKGPGWYIGKNNDTVLVIPHGEVSNPWRQKGWSKAQLFVFMVYSDRSPIHLFGLIATAPVREDTR